MRRAPRRAYVTSLFTLPCVYVWLFISNVTRSYNRTPPQHCVWTMEINELGICILLAIHGAQNESHNCNASCQLVAVLSRRRCSCTSYYVVVRCADFNLSTKQEIYRARLVYFYIRGS